MRLMSAAGFRTPRKDLGVTPVLHETLPLVRMLPGEKLVTSTGQISAHVPKFCEFPGVLLE
jgi:hypothetical protein